MKRINSVLFILVTLILTVNPIVARENLGQNPFKVAAVEVVLSGCTPAKTQTTLDINNVRTTILTGGDTWWDLIGPKYEVPKGGGAHSLFAGSLWIGGIDAGAQLKVAAMTYRQSGIDFWPGPLDLSTVSIQSTTCDAYDKHFVITRKEVENFVNNISTSIPNSIISWPGNGTGDQEKSLAPFYDKNGDGFYDPSAGDYPKYSLDSKKFGCEERQIFGDKTLWWVFNDKGNIHTETKGNSIGLEVRAQAFAFESSDEINNMTFYDYEVINRSSVQLNKTYFGVWVDADLGYAFDDYVGCDVKNGIGYCYNGLPTDGTGAVGTYGANPPAIGVDFFRGPKVGDPSDGLDSYGTSFVDPSTNRINMAKFVYYNNDFTVTGNPVKATDYYNYLSGFWIDGTPFTYGGNAKGGTTVCDFMFPGKTDPTGLGAGGVAQPDWSEASVGNPVGDRRFMQSAGPFTLKPGAVNNVTFGVVWAKSNVGGPLASVQLMQDADVKAQGLFKSCFRILNGPDAPDLTIQELDKQIIIYLTNKSTSNNNKESYKELDPLITIAGNPDSLYKFEGYIVYQIADSSVSVSDFSNPDKARVIYQSDVKNGVGQIINFYKNASLNNTWVPIEMVNGADLGISRSFVVDKDLFAKGDNKLINHKKYFFTAIAYAYNAGEASLDPINRPDGLNLPFVSSRNNVIRYSAIPHIVSPEANGTEQHANYGDGVELTRIEGQGNGGRVLDFNSQTIIDILKSGVNDGNSATNGGRSVNVTYARGAGPIEIKVIDPLNVPPGCFTIAITDTTQTGRWILKNSNGVVFAVSDTTLLIGSEQIIPELGLSVKATYVYDVPSLNAPGVGGVLESTVDFSDPTKPWLIALPDAEGSTKQNWIRSGKVSLTTAADLPFNDYAGIDDNGYFEKILNGTWAPYRLCAQTDPSAQLLYTSGPAWGSFLTTNDMRRTLASVDVVFTSDKSKWTRCPVIEMQDEAVLAKGNARKMDLRASPSIDKNGNFSDGVTVDFTNENAPGYMAATGMGWFPGYAINIETGERLNMAYGEDSYLPNDNGQDMKWNPSSTIYSTPGFDPIFGGKHYIYVFAHSSDRKFLANDAYLPNGPQSMPRYDGGLAMWQLLNTVKTMGVGNNKYKQVPYNDAMWVNIPILNGSPGRELLETDVKVRIRVARKFRRGFTASIGTLATSQAVVDTLSPSLNNNFPLYSFCTNDIEAHKGDKDVAKNALDLINVVPNPYYAYSGYEGSQIDNTIKVTNLPEKCTIRIYTVNGTLIRTFKKDSQKTSLDWDLKNQANTGIASGLYIIHVDAPGIGEKILKWFGVLRPVDLDSY